MAKKVEKRFPNMKEFAEALEQWLMSADPGSLRGSTTLTHVSAARRPAPAPTPRRRSGALALLGILLLVGGIVVAGFYAATTFLGSHQSTVRTVEEPTLKSDPPLVQPPPIVPPAPAAFRELFNGKDLTGWVPDNTAAAEWQVEDKTLTIKGNGAATSGWLLTDRAYEDFTLHFDFRLAKGAKSGIALRAEPGNRIGAHSYHMKTQIFDDLNPTIPNPPTGSLLWCDDSEPIFRPKSSAT